MIIGIANLSVYNPNGYYLYHLNKLGSGAGRAAEPQHSSRSLFIEMLLFFNDYVTQNAGYIRIWNLKEFASFCFYHYNGGDFSPL